MDAAWESLRSTLAGYGVAPRWAAHVAVALKLRACWATAVPVADWPSVREALDLAGCDHVAVPSADGLAYTVFSVGAAPPPFGEPAGLLGPKAVGEVFIDAVAAAHPTARAPASEEWGRAVREHEAQLPPGFHDPPDDYRPPAGRNSRRAYAPHTPFSLPRTAPCPTPRP